MSLMKVDYATYARLLEYAIGDYIAKGNSPAEACRLAQEEMVACFVIDNTDPDMMLCDIEDLWNPSRDPQ